MKPAIVVVGYNRPKDIERLLNNLNNAEYSSNDIPLIISLDKASNETEVVAVAEQFDWKYGQKIIRTFSERQGLRKHIIQCGELSCQYGAVIILEDDLLVSKNFYNYVQEALDFYSNDDKVTGISLYSHEWNGYARRNFIPVADEYDCYYGQYSITWGQCWTKKWWDSFYKWYLKQDDNLPDNNNIPRNINRWSKQSWGKYFVNYIVENDLYYIIPRISLSTNCSDIGQHVKQSDNVHQVRLLESKKKRYVFPNYNQAIKYDIHFENKDLERYFVEYTHSEPICININGNPRNYENYRYILTTTPLPYKIIKTYGLQLRPYEMNIIYDIPGNEICLYDTSISCKKPKNRFNSVMRYEIRGFSCSDIRSYYFFLLKHAIYSRLKRFIK